MNYERMRNTVANKDTELESLPIEIARIVKEEDSLTAEQQREAFTLIRKWIDYVKTHEVLADDPYILRSHIEAFAFTELHEGAEKSYEEVLSFPVSEIRSPEGRVAGEMVEHLTDPVILNDPRIIVYGGVVRTLLKAHLLNQNKGHASWLDAELPMNDVDMMIVGPENAQLIAEHYGSDISGTKIVRDAELQIQEYIDTVDVTMNQNMIHNGRLYYTPQSLEDLAEGNIRSCSRPRPLFGGESAPLPNGEQYLFRNSFYRTLAMLLRGRGERIIVSQENIDAEKDNIGLYWLLLLFVKILKMEDEKRRNEAVLQWHQVASDIGSTETESPADFLQELSIQNPEFSYFKKDNTFDADAQTRWLIGKLVSRGSERIEGPRNDVQLPKTYTPANLHLRAYEGSQDLAEFWELVKKYSAV